MLAGGLLLSAPQFDAQDKRYQDSFVSGVSDPASLKRELLSRVDRARASLSELLAVQGPRTVENTLQPYDDLLGE